MPIERRSRARETVSIPVWIGCDGCGTTRDVSESGVFLETDWDGAVDPVLDLEFDLAAGPMRPFRFVAQGVVVRREDLGSRTGVALRLLAMRVQAQS